MKLWKILVATMIALLLVCAVAMADECPLGGNHTYDSKAPVITYANHGDNAHYKYVTTEYFCACSDKYYEKTETSESCTWVDNGAKVDATCTTDGYQPKKCSVCQRTGKSDIVDAYKHWPEENWSASASTSATCQAKAQYVYKCRTCGEPCKWVEYGNKADCVTEEVVTTPATCTAMGVAEVRCKWCKKLYGTTQVKANGHSYDLVDSKDSTCTTKGWKLSVCIVCGDAKTEELKLANHWLQLVNEVAATCAKDGVAKHHKCRDCGALYNAAGNAPVDAASLVLPKKSGAHIVDTTKNVTKHFSDCAAFNNYQHAFCKVCGLEFDTPIAPKDHRYKEIKASNAMNVTTTPTCVKAGAGVFACEDCGQRKSFEIPANGHNYGPWHYENIDSCTLDLTGYRGCGDCGYVEHKTIEAAPGHTWVEEKGTKPTCTEAGKVDRKCAKCGVVEYGKTIAALGHDFTKVVEVVKPTCEAQGYTVYTCSRGCADTKKADYTTALGHNYQWEVVTKPSASSNGKNEYTCQTCGKVADTKTVKYTNWYYNNTMTSDGPSTRELVGGNDWYRVTPVDLTVDGVYTCDLIASNKYVVGTVTITVNAGTLTVSYSVKGNVDVKDESLLIYTSEANLAAGSAVTAPVGAAINIAETFGGETNVLVSLLLIGDYDAAGKTVAAN